MELDHLAVVCSDLDTGAAAVEAALGVPLHPGGRHDRYGTHNRLLRLGDGEYLEVIAPDPAARPAGPRWFGLDHVTGPAHLGNWICRVPDLGVALAAAPSDAGVPVALERGDFAWSIAVPPDGSLPMAGGYPTLIAWRGAAHPADRLPDDGLRLTALEVCHPAASAIAARLIGQLADPRLRFITADTVALRACIETRAGERWL